MVFKNEKHKNGKLDVTTRTIKASVNRKPREALRQKEKLLTGSATLSYRTMKIWI